MLDLSQFQIELDIRKPTPYFQSTPERRIRFLMEDLTASQLKEILQTIFQKDRPIHLLFVAAYIHRFRRYSAKARVGSSITIRNWKEYIVEDEGAHKGVIYAHVKDIELNEIISYCTNVYRGYTSAYIVFHDSVFLLYVSTDVVDVIGDATSIKSLKETYVDLYDRLYDDFDHALRH
ncbi:hypothetical protein [Exiguobacterium acetylicum]|uniref:hypothetical protein n=1 Tax=Exiguobacterium acetylicum TaxID=41170 RepID=UPI001CA68F88|nr:hypothetical protein [Exiguobacterium acetylicum]QZY88195.1 hypothetical protein K7G97_07625 [Exiguobacterium acetylicum]